MAGALEKATENPSLKVVAHLTDGRLIKGFTDVLPSTDSDALLKHNPVHMPTELVIRSLESNKIVSVPLGSLKALFFVKSFEGRSDYTEVKFFEGHPLIEGLLVRMRFQDGEVTEGVVRNSLSHLIDPGFLLKPPDPLSNNEIVYVVKASLAEFEVLGVRHTY